MRGLTQTEAQPTRPALLGHPLVRDAVVVVAWFAVAAAIGALVWWQVTPLAEFTRTATNAQMDEEQLGRQVSADGWFFVIGALGGLVSGIALLTLRRRDPVATVVLVALGGLLASWLMLRLGVWLGPANPKDVLSDVAVGHKVPLQLKTHTAGVDFAWPLGALLGAVGVLWSSDDRRGHEEPAPGANEG
ncbi:hypothetical protein ACVW00_002462 [Marmoricola sp. URHA0025 HA25]